jgi:hypothetical protein
MPWLGSSGGALVRLFGDMALFKPWVSGGYALVEG